MTATTYRPREEDFNRVEGEIKGVLPGILRSALARCNGFYARFLDDTWTVFPVRVDADRTSMTRTFDDIAQRTRSAREYHSLPSGWIPIAAVPEAGRWLVLSQSGEDGSLGLALYEWSREMDTPVLVADHLSELLDGQERR